MSQGMIALQNIIYLIKEIKYSFSHPGKANILSIFCCILRWANRIGDSILLKIDKYEIFLYILKSCTRINKYRATHSLLLLYKREKREMWHLQQTGKEVLCAYRRNGFRDWSKATKCGLHFDTSLKKRKNRWDVMKGIRRTSQWNIQC